MKRVGLSKEWKELFRVREVLSEYSVCTGKVYILKTTKPLKKGFVFKRLNLLEDKR